MLDLGESRDVSRVKITVQGGATALEARVPAEPATAAPMDSQQQWRRVAGVDARKGSFTLTFDAEPTRYVLIDLTELPPVEKDYFRGAIAEVEVFG